jgi:hypothetical protein
MGRMDGHDAVPAERAEYGEVGSGDEGYLIFGLPRRSVSPWRLC